MAGAEVTTLENNYAAITTLNLSGKNTSKYAISTGVLVNFTGLTSLNLSDTGITDLGGLAGLKNLKELDVSNNTFETIPNNDQLGAIAGLTNLTKLNLSNTKITAISAIANLKQLEELDISGTSILDLNVFWKGSTPTFASLTSLKAQNIETLISIAGLVEIVNLSGFKADGLTWDLGTSTLKTDSDNHIGIIQSKFTQTTGKFTAPIVK